MGNLEILEVGKAAPVIKTVNSRGENLDLKKLVGSNRHVVLTFFRGHW